jgi:hypothetical protein
MKLVRSGRTTSKVLDSVHVDFLGQVIDLNNWVQDTNDQWAIPNQALYQSAIIIVLSALFY